MSDRPYVDFTAPCPGCADPVEWRATLAIVTCGLTGSSTSGVVHTIDCPRCGAAEVDEPEQVAA